MSGGFIEDDYEVEMSSDGTPGGDCCLPMEALAEWRSSEQVENGITSTSPPYWDTDEDDDECGAKPSELYGKSTWKIENFSQINKRELRSNAFEVGGYKWYILIYPQGCDVCNHLSLFLCVANHDKLLPGWSHFAQFTIAVVNKDVKKSKYSDTLHRFWKKEHDWGWKKFMELSKVLDGFIDNDTLVIKAQVQVIRDRADRPFRCLDCLYRRELVRVYLTNVEQICRRFVEERRGKLVKLIEDKARWSSFCDFWSEVDQGSRRRMSREKTDAILRVVVKHFFIEKEVTTTLVMDSLYSGLRALTCQSKSKKARAKLLDTEETPAPIVRIEKDMFVLAEDVLVLLERASLEPLPPKDEKGPQNRTKDGCSGEDSNKDPIERDERRLTELGRRTVEIFVLAHIFSNRIEVAHQEAVALKKQEELIREEEAAGQAESEHKGKRGATEKEKRAKKKQSKQKRGRRKVKDKGKDAKSYVLMQDKQQGGTPKDGRTAVDISFSEEPSLLEKSDAVDDVSNGTDTGDDGSERLQHELENQDACELQHAIESNCTAIESDCSGVSILVGNEHAEKKKTSVMDDSSSTCSTDSVISVVINGPNIGTPLANNTSQTSPRRRRKPHSREIRDTTVWGHGTENQLAQPVIDLAHQYDASKGTATRSEPESLLSLKDRIKWLEQHLDEKQEEVVTLQKKLNVKDVVDIERPLKQKIGTEALSSQSSITEYPSSSVLSKPELEGSVLIEPVPVGETHSNNVQKTEKATSLRIVSTQIYAVSKPDVQSAAVPPKGISSLAEKPTAYEGPLTSRPSSAPIVVPKPCAPVVSMGQTAPALARSVSATGRLGFDPSPATNSYVPSSYRNAMMGKNMATNPSGFVPCLPSSISPTPVCSQSPASVSSPMLSSQSSSSKDQVVAKSGFTFGSVSQDVLQNRPVTISESSQPGPSSTQCDPSLLTNLQNLNIYGIANSESRAFSDDAFPTSMSGRQTQGMLVEEFPHLDIINSLFDEEYGIGKTARATEVLHIPNNSHHHQLNRQYTFPGDISMSADTANCCRFDRPGGYHDDGMHRSYGSPSSPFDRSMNAVPQVDTSLFANGQIDRVLQNQWPASVGHMPSHGRRNTEGDLYSYQIPDYSNLGCGVNGYTMFRPSNGH